MELQEAVEGARALDGRSAEGAVRAAPFGREGGEELRVAVVAGGRVVERAEEALGRLAGAGRVRLEPERGEDLGHVAAIALPVGGRDVAALGRRGRGGELLPELGWIRHAVTPFWCAGD